MNPNQKVIVNLVDSDGNNIRLSEVYLTVSFFLNGAYRFAFRSPSSSDAGQIVVSYENLEASRLRNLKVQPLDYKTKLEDCDPLIEISVPQKEELVRAAEILESMGLGKYTEIAKGWRASSNDQVQSSVQKVYLNEATIHYDLVCVANP